MGAQINRAGELLHVAEGSVDNGLHGKDSSVQPGGDGGDDEQLRAAAAAAAAAAARQQHRNSAVSQARAKAPLEAEVMKLEQALKRKEEKDKLQHSVDVLREKLLKQQAKEEQRIEVVFAERACERARE